MSYNCKLVVRDRYSEDIFDLVSLSNQIKMSDIKTDSKVIEGNRFSGFSTGLGIISVGRKIDFGIPILEYKDELNRWVKIEHQYTKYSSIILSNTAKRFFIRIEYDNEIYEAEHIMTSVSGYNIKYINNLGIITISLEAIDKVFLRQKEESYKLNISEDLRQDIKYSSLSLVPVPLTFSLLFDIVGNELNFTFANRDNFGIQFFSEVQNGYNRIYFDGYNLTINGINYDYKGLQPELNVGENILYLDSNQVCKEAIIYYKRGILL